MLVFLFCAAAAAGFGGTVAVAAETEFEVGPTELNPGFVGKKKKAWQEQAVTLPSLPATGADTSITLSVVGSDYRYILDLDTLSVDADGVVRYAVTVVSSSGARNQFYEGLRCQTAQYKTYAYESQGKWREAVYPAWRRVTRGAGLDFRRVLYQDYFCDDLEQPRGREEIIADLKRADRARR